MKLISLYLDEYKLLKDFNIVFKKDISIIIGINGSGKSSILEAIAQIFSDLILEQKSKFGFKLKYELRLEEILEQTATSSVFRTDYIGVEISAIKKNCELSFKVFVEDKVLEKKEDIEKRFNEFEKILPSNIIVYYSGLSDIMKNICEPHDQILSKQYRDGNTNMHRPFFYFEPELYNIILLCLLSYEFGEIPDYLYRKAKIKTLLNIQIKLKKPRWVKQQKIDTWWGAKGEVKIFLDYIKKLTLSLEVSEGLSNEYSNGNIIIEAWENEAIIITILGNQKLFQIREYFLEERKLFQILNTLYIDGFLDTIQFLFANDEGVNFKTLSEGEQQAITIKGLAELVTKENSLSLFDEPDTYLHPSWQEEFLFDLIEYTEKTHFLVTTHSPQLLANADPQHSELFILLRGKLQENIPNYFGKDVNSILYTLMNSAYRNEHITSLLNELFKAIALNNLEKSESLYLVLESILGSDDPEMVAAKIEIDYLKFDGDEVDSQK